MPIRSQSMYGSGPLTPAAVRKINALISRAEVTSVNGMSPMKMTPHGVVALYRNRAIGAGRRNLFSGTAYIKGVKFTGLSNTPAKPWLHIVFDPTATPGVTVTEDAGPPPDPWGANDSWRAKADIMGALYID